MKVRNKQIVTEESIELLEMKIISKAELLSTHFQYALESDRKAKCFLKK